MNDSAAFYQTFYQNETLFRVDEPLQIRVEKAVVEQADRTAPKKEEPQTVAAETVQPVASGTEEKKVRTSTLPPSGQETPTLPNTPPPTAPFPTLQHKVLILVDEKSQEDLLPADALLLENILKATGHDPAETDLLNFSHLPQADARAVLAQKSTNYFISFGVPLIKLKLDLLLPPYTPKQIEGIWFLLAEPLSVIDADKARKKRLWLALKQMFAMA